MLKWGRFKKKKKKKLGKQKAVYKIDWKGSFVVCNLILEVVSTQCGEGGCAAKLMDGWTGCLISRLPQVVSH